MYISLSLLYFYYLCQIDIISSFTVYLSRHVKVRHNATDTLPIMERRSVFAL